MVKVNKRKAADDGRDNRIDDKQEILQLSKEIDDILEQKSAKHNLSAINVKSILSHLIKNDQVLNMLRNSIRNSSDSCRSDSAVCEKMDDFNLKLTRNRTKALIMKGVVPMLSPSTHSNQNNSAPCSSAAALLTSNYENENEDDEDIDYTPDDENLSGGDEDESGEDGDRNDNAEETDLVLPNYETRSKKSYDNVALDELEAALYSIRPDFEVDLRVAQDREEDYLDFLTSTTAGPSSNIQPECEDDDTTSDPEYNFCEDTEIVDDDETELNKATEITKKELNDLFNDYLFGLLGEKHINQELIPHLVQTVHGAEQVVIESTLVDGPQSWAKAEDAQRIVLVCGDETTNFSATLMCGEGNLPLFTQTEQDMLKEQLRKHVQLLTQTFLLSKYFGNYQEADDIVSSCLDSLRQKRDQHKSPSTSFYNIWNLPQAEDVIKKAKKLEFRDIYANSGRRMIEKKREAIAELVRDSTCFLYPHLLFIFPLTNRPAWRSRVMKGKFTDSEEMVLALGYLQFYCATDDIEELSLLINEYCMTPRSPLSIKCKLLKNKSKFLKNMLSDTVTEKKYPKFVRTLHPFDPENVKMPINWPSKVRPKWLTANTGRGAPVVIECQLHSFINKPPNDKLLSGVLCENGIAYSVACPREHLKYAIEPPAPSPSPAGNVDNTPVVIRIAQSPKPLPAAKQDDKQQLNHEAVYTRRVGKRSLTKLETLGPKSPSIIQVSIDSPISFNNYNENYAIMENFGQSNPLLTHDHVIDLELDDSVNCEVLSSTSHVAFTEHVQLEPLLEAVSPHKANVSPMKRRKQSKVVNKYSPSPTKKAIKFLNRMKKTKCNDAEEEGRKALSDKKSDESLTKLTFDHEALHFGQSLLPRDQKMEKTNYDNRVNVQDIEVLSSEVDSPALTEPTSANKKTPKTVKRGALRNKTRAGKSGKCRGIKNCQLKNLLHLCPTTYFNPVSQALAAYLCDLTKKALFMHQSHLESFLNCANEGMNGADTLQNFDALMTILNQLPSSSTNAQLAESLSVFMSARDSLIAGRFNSFRNYRLAANTLLKMKLFCSEIKRKSSLRAIISNIKDSLAFPIDMFKLYEYLKGNFDCAEYAALWDHLKPLFPHEMCDNEQDEFEFIDSKSFLAPDDVSSLNFENATFKQQEFRPLKSSNNYEQSNKALCRCLCHKEARSNISHCNSCVVKILDGKWHVWETGKLIPAEASYTNVNIVFESGEEDTSRATDEVDNFKEPSRLIHLDQRWQNASGVKKFLNLVDIVEKHASHLISTLHYSADSNSNYFPSQENTNHREIQEPNNFQSIDGDTDKVPKIQAKPDNDSPSSNDLLQKALLDTFGTCDFSLNHLDQTAQNSNRSSSPNFDVNIGTSEIIDNENLIMGSDSTLICDGSNFFSNSDLTLPGICNDSHITNGDCSFDLLEFDNSAVICWSEVQDRCLLEELRRHCANVETACVSAAKILKLDVSQVLARMRLLVQLLEEVNDG